MDAKTYDCPNCGANLQFDPESQKFCCEYCNGSFTESEVLNYAQQVLEYERQKHEMPKEEEPTDDQQRDMDEFSENTRLYQCPGCGAQIVADVNTAASFCYYCHNPVILKGRVDGVFKPSMVLPFGFDREKAEEYFNDWAGKKFFVPKDLKSKKQIEKMTGLYVPFWVADAVNKMHFTGQGKVVRSWSSGSYRYTNTKIYDIVRDMTIEYDGVPGDGSRKIEDSLMEAIEPFDYTAAKDFNMAYLSGFYADKYDVEKEEMYPRIYDRMFRNSCKEVNATCHYSSVSGKKYDNKVSNLRWHYMLLPVWFMTFDYKGKLWEYAINGQTGKISGELPIDKKKLVFGQIGMGLLFFVIALILGYFIGGLF